ncbi:MAG: hypothetical protein WCF96_03105 [Eubacteriales bacterium]
MQDSGNLQFDLFGNIIKYDMEMIIVVAMIIVILFFVWLILRAPRLWYWKISHRTEKLKEIEDRLEMIQEKIGEVEVLAENIALEDIPSNKIHVLADEEPIEITHVNAKINQIPIEEDNQISNEDKAIIQDEQYIGKSGKVYTRKDLEAKIKK